MNNKEHKANLKLVVHNSIFIMTKFGVKLIELCQYFSDDIVHKLFNDSSSIIFLFVLVVGKTLAASYFFFHSCSTSSSSMSEPSSSISSSSIIPFMLSSIGRFLSSAASSLSLNISSNLLSYASGIECLLLTGTGGGGNTGSTAILLKKIKVSKIWNVNK